MRVIAKDLTLRFGDTAALDHLSVDLAEGAIHGLLGRNGSGKTSLLSLIAGYRRPTAGSLTVGGVDPFEDAATMGGTAFVRDALDVTDAEAGRAALRFAADLRPSFDLEYAHQLADQFGVPLRKTVGGLSRGQKSALGVALGLAARAPLTIFDEAYLGMDAPSRYAFYRLLLDDYVAHPRTIIISTHLIEEVANLFERVVVLDHGRVIADDETDELRGRGVTATGPAEAVDAYVAGRTVLSEQRLGGTKAATVYGRPDAGDRERARAAGVELGPVGLQDLFVHLTGAPRAKEAHR